MAHNFSGGSIWAVSPVRLFESIRSAKHSHICSTSIEKSSFHLPTLHFSFFSCRFLSFSCVDQARSKRPGWEARWGPEEPIRASTVTSASVSAADVASMEARATATTSNDGATHPAYAGEQHDQHDHPCLFRRVLGREQRTCKLHLMYVRFFVILCRKTVCVRVESFARQKRVEFLSCFRAI